MGKQVLFGLLAVSILAMWGSAANAFNRINGIIIKHRSIEVDVRVCGDPLQSTKLTLVLKGKVELTCENPGGHVPKGKPGHPTFPFTFTASEVVTSGDFTTEVTCDSGNDNNATALIPFTFDFPSAAKCKPKWTQVGAELINVAATATWRCIGTGPECQDEDDTTIEVVRTTCPTSLPIDSDCDREGHDDLQHVGDAGQPPPPLEEPMEACVDLHLHCKSNSPVLETVCGVGEHVLMSNTAAKISYVTFQGNTSSVVLNHCNDESYLAGESLEIFQDTNLCHLEGGCCSHTRWNDRICSVEIQN